MTLPIAEFHNSFSSLIATSRLVFFRGPRSDTFSLDSRFNTCTMNAMLVILALLETNCDSQMAFHSCPPYLPLSVMQRGARCHTIFSLICLYNSRPGRLSFLQAHLALCALILGNKAGEGLVCIKCELSPAFFKGAHAKNSFAALFSFQTLRFPMDRALVINWSTTILTYTCH
jgi:hypothetical protein